MALKDIWKDKVDDVDEVLAEDINLIAGELIKTQEKKADKATTLEGYGITDALSKGEAVQAFGAIDERLTTHYYTRTQTDSKFQEKLTSTQLQNIADVTKKADVAEVEKLEGDVRNQFSNALKGTASGEAIGLHDVSPIEHTMAVKVRSKNLNEDVTSVKVNKYGANLFNVAEVLERTSAGLKTSIAEDGGIVISGVATDTVRYMATGGGFENQVLLLPGTYTVIGHVLLVCVLTSLDGKSVWRKGTFTLEKPAYFKNIVFSGLTVGTEYNMTVYPCLSVGDNAEYETYKEPITYTPNADGTVEGVTSLYPSTTLLIDTEGVVIDCEYNRDINKAFEELTQAIISLGGNV